MDIIKTKNLMSDLEQEIIRDIAQIYAMSVPVDLNQDPLLTMKKDCLIWTRSVCI